MMLVILIGENMAAVSHQLDARSLEKKGAWANIRKGMETHGMPPRSLNVIKGQWKSMLEKYYLATKSDDAPTRM